MNYPVWYEKISRPFRGSAAARVLRAADKTLVGLFVCEYVCLLACAFGIFQMLLGGPEPDAMGISPVQAVAVPALVFVVAAGLRTLLDKPRPYEAYAIHPVFEERQADESKRGKSMPSLHVASAGVIALSACFAFPSPATAVVQCALCLAVAFTRITGGVHFPQDVLVSLALALAIGIPGFIL